MPEIPDRKIQSNSYAIDTFLTCTTIVGFISARTSAYYRRKPGRAHAAVEVSRGELAYSRVHLYPGRMDLDLKALHDRHQDVEVVERITLGRRHEVPALARLLGWGTALRIQWVRVKLMASRGYSCGFDEDQPAWNVLNDHPLHSIPPSPLTAMGKFEKPDIPSFQSKLCFSPRYRAQKENSSGDVSYVRKKERVGLFGQFSSSQK
ncbi:hypothetical protein ARMGADRAFT_1086016 [Armillaria gallica]|uniref:Uncharacterized protein n=1 Tax=Armillaria gallica TaxID=47427 RepID=A0A2H3CYK1_ARMGA|nr:hypothetical protein ARMGADRAFT_1086016 [Armillaria gallica]